MKRLAPLIAFALVTLGGCVGPFSCGPGMPGREEMCRLKCSEKDGKSHQDCMLECDNAPPDPKDDDDGR